MKKLMLLAIAFMVSAVSAWALPASLPQLENQAAYVASALSRVQGGLSYISGFYVSPTNGSPYAEVENDDGYQDILDQLALKTLAFRTLEPATDNLSTTIMLFDENHEILIWGSKWYYAEGSSDIGWSLPADAGRVQIDQMSYWQYIDVGDDVVYGYLYMRDENGNVIGTRYVEIYDGRMEWAMDWFGAGTLVLYDEDGGVAAYNLKDGGKQLPLESFSLNAVGDMSHFVERIPENIGYHVSYPQSDNGYGHAKVIEVEVTTTRNIYFAGVTTENEWADKLVVQNAETGARVQELYMRPGYYTAVQFRPGKYFIYLRWERGFDGFRSQSYGGGGKG